MTLFTYLRVARPSPAVILALGEVLSHTYTSRSIKVTYCPVEIEPLVA